MRQKLPSELRLDLSAILGAARELLARPENDFTGSGWSNQESALRNLDWLISVLDSGHTLSYADHERLFALDGPVEEVAIRSGWMPQYLEVVSSYEHIRKILFAYHIGPLALWERGLLLDPVPDHSLPTGFEPEVSINCL